MQPTADTALGLLLQEEIRRSGPISFKAFMEAALYHPLHGYYGSDRARLGKSGDYYTSVHVHALFGRLLARQFEEMWHALGECASFTIIEQGAHHGLFAGDVLEWLQKHAPGCYAATTYRIVEPSGPLRLRQQQRLAAFGGKTCWSEQLDGVPVSSGVHFSNELVDAFPVHLLRWSGGEWRERYVAWTQEGLSLIDGPLSSAALATHCLLLPSASEGYETEVNLQAPAWLVEVAGRLDKGFVLTIDYGFTRAEYYREERVTGTLSAFRAHQRIADPLAHAGEMDLTAHVDFTSLGEAAQRAGLRLAGYTDQHHFMVGLGQMHFKDDAPLTKEMQAEIRAFQTLMHPALLGQTFKAVCFAKGLPELPQLAGFKFSTGAQAALA